MFQRYGLNTSFRSGFVAENEQKQIKTVEEIAEDLKVANLIVEDMELGAKNLGQTNYFERRGISKEIAIRYNCGFIKDWTHPKRRGEKNVVSSDR